MSQGVAVRTYTGGGLQPIMYPERARTESVKLSPGTYAKGTCVGQVSTLTAAADVQTITFTGTPTGGTFRLSFNGEATSAIAYSVTDATLQANILAALIALTGIGTGNVTVSSGTSGTVVTVTFAGSLVNRWQPLLVLYSNSLTGGTAPTFTVAHTTPGRALGGEWRAYDDTASDGTNVMKGVLQYAVVVDTFGFHTVGGGEWNGGRELSAPIYISGYFRCTDLTGLDAAGVTDCGRFIVGAIGTITDAGTIIEIY